MAVYAWCTKCNRRRDAAKEGGLECADKVGHKRQVGWWADVRFGEDNRIRKFYGPKRENPKELADSFERGLKTDHDRGELKLTKKAPILFGPLADKYWIEHAMVECRNPERTTLYLVEKAKEWIGVDRKISPLTEDELKKFQDDMRSLQRTLRSQGLTGATVNRQFNIMRAILEKGREWGIITVNPLELVIRVQEDEPAPRFLEQKEIDHLFYTAAHITDEDGPIAPERIERLLNWMTVLGHTGARPSSIEECSFDNGDADLTNKVIWFTTYKGGRKRKKHRYPVPMDDILFELVMRRAELTGRQGPVFDCAGIRELEVMAIDQSKLNDGKPDNMRFTMYGLKHCYASHLLMMGATEREVADLLGHTDPRMVHKHYGHLTIGHLRKVQNRINLTPAQLKVV